MPGLAGGGFVKQVPALVVSGFLGCGKTTLVRRILAQAQSEGVKVAVVSNEFGELGIDEDALRRAIGDVHNAPTEPTRKGASKALFRLLHDRLAALPPNPQN